MSLNKFAFQLVIIAEDENLVDVAQGFHEGMEGDRRIHVEPVEGKRRSHHGWQGAVNSLVNYNLPVRTLRHVLLFIDFDKDSALRISGVWKKISDMGLESCKSRIHIIGVTSQSEDIDRRGVSFREFGCRIADVCLGRCQDEVWSQPAFKDNGSELCRLRETVCCKLSSGSQTHTSTSLMKPL